jgi:uncharacterized protein
VKVRFEWDPGKAAINLRKHGVSFETAIRVFADPLALFEEDRRAADEVRWLTIGSVEYWQILVVVHVVRERDGLEVIRIISARKANGHERRRYEEESST